MNRFYISLLLTLAAAGSVLAQSKFNFEGRQILEKVKAEPAALKTMSVGQDENDMTAVLIQSDGNSAVAELEARGYETFYVSENFSIVYMPVNEIGSLENIDAVESASFGTMSRPMMDKARNAGSVNAVHRGTGLGESMLQNRPFKGDGVLVGMFDTGFDPQHVNFMNADGTTSRIESYWRFTGSGTSKQYTGDEIMTAPTDLTSKTHGTHVAGIMGGSYDGEATFKLLNDMGQVTTGTNLPYFGVAPEANLVICAGQLYTNSILVGIRQMINYAKEVNKPLTVNLSLGDNSGPHDGTDATSKALAELGEEAIICVAAGNDGDANIHAGKTFTANDTELKFFAQNDTIRGNVEIWSTSSDMINLSVVLFDKTARQVVETISVPADKATMLNSQVSQVFANNFSGSITFYPNLDPNNNRFTIGLDCNNVTAKASNNNIHLGFLIKGKSGERIDVYTSNVNQFTNNGIAGWDNGNTDGSISGMACGENIIVVGAFNTRNRWPVINGDIYSYTSPFPVNAIASYSSWGTLADGRNLPMITAPGTGIISSYSTPYLNANTAQKATASAVTTSKVNGVDRQNYWVVEQGTSMATPFVTGTVGLWLEADPDLTVGKARSIMESTATTTGVTSDVWWGAGKINALRGIKEVIATKGTGGVDNIESDAESRLKVITTDGRLFTIFFDQADGFTATLYSLSGGAVKLVVTGSESAELDASSLTGGIYLLEVNGKSGRATRKLTVR